MFRSIISVLSKYFYNWCVCVCVCVCVLVILECGEVSFTDTRDGVMIYYIIEIHIPAYLVLFFSIVVAINRVFLSRVLINANNCKTTFYGGRE